MKLILIILSFIPLIADARTFVLNATSGYIVITSSVTVSSTTPTSAGGLLPGDTLKLNPAGVYSALSFQGVAGTNSNHITVYGNGAYCTSPVSYQPTSWFDLKYIDFVDFAYRNWYGNNLSSYNIHHIKFDHLSVVNGSSATDTSHFITTFFWQWDDKDHPMKFRGSKDSTFYNVTYDSCTFSGFKNTGPLQMGTAWNDSATVERSICLDFAITNSTFKNVMNTQQPGGGSSGNRIVLINAVGMGWTVSGNRVIDFDEATLSYTHSHSVFLELKGSVDFHNNYMTNSFGAMLRLTPLTWSKLPGYSLPSYQYNNISHHTLSYSPFEINQNNKNQLISDYGFNEAADTCMYNTVFVTKGQPDAARYYGFVVDFVNQNLGYVGYNVIVRPEIDFTYDSTGRSGYFVAIVSSAPSSLTKVGNFAAQFWNSYPIWDDTLNFIPSTNSVLLNTGAAFTFRTYDYYYNPLVGTPDRGAVERQADPSAPGCTTNNTTTSITQTTATINWNAAAGATSYKVYLYVNGGSAPGSPSYTTSSTSQAVTGLTAGLTYRYYVTPANATGDATGCSTAYTTFTMLSDGPSTKPFKLKRK